MIDVFLYYCHDKKKEEVEYFKVLDNLYLKTYIDN